MKYKIGVIGSGKTTELIKDMINDPKGILLTTDGIVYALRKQYPTLSDRFVSVSDITFGKVNKRYNNVYIDNVDLIMAIFCKRLVIKEMTFTKMDNTTVEINEYKFNKNE